MDIFALAGLKKAKDAQESVDRLGVPLEFKGVVSTYEDLPFSGNSKGDIYFTSSDGFEYVWTSIISSGYHWEKLGANSAGKVYLFTVTYNDNTSSYEVTAPEDSADSMYNDLCNGATVWICYDSTNAPYPAPKDLLRIDEVYKNEQNNRYTFATSGLVDENSGNNSYIEKIRLVTELKGWTVEIIYKEIIDELPATTLSDVGKVLTVGSTGAAEWDEAATPTPVSLDSLEEELYPVLMAAAGNAESSGFFGISLDMAGSETTVEKANSVVRAAKVGAISAIGNTFYLIQSALFDEETHVEGLEGTGQVSFFIPNFMADLGKFYTFAIIAVVSEGQVNDEYVPTLAISAWAIKLANYPSNQ